MIMVMKVFNESMNHTLWGKYFKKLTKDKKYQVMLMKKKNGNISFKKFIVMK